MKPGARLDSRVVIVLESKGDGTENFTFAIRRCLLLPRHRVSVSCWELREDHGRDDDAKRRTGT